MATIRAKKKPVIKKGEGFVYNPAALSKEHGVDNFHEVEDPQIILDNIVPMELWGSKYLFFDTETHPHYKSSQDLPPSVVRRWVGTGKKAVPQDYPFSMQIGDENNVYCIYDTIENNFEKFKKLAPLFLDPSITLVIHNAKFDMHMMQNAKMRIVGKLMDTVVVAKIANENRMSFRLLDLASKVPGGIVKFEYMVDHYKQVNRVTDYRQIPRELLTMYGCADVWNLKHVFIKEMTSIIQQDKDSKPGQTLLGLLDTEMELMIALYAMERRGMRLDLSYEKSLKEDLQKIVDDAETAVYEMAGEIFNMNSGMQVAKIMRKLGVDEKVLRYTDKGNVKLDKFEMARLDEIYGIPIIGKIQTYKQAEKLLNTYAVGIYGQADSRGYVHGSINQTEATTGRMSITKPALQTLPKKDKRIRRAFIPEEDFTLWLMDLDQVEYRGLSHYAKAQGLIAAINAGYDIHKATGALIFHKDLDDVTDEERSKAKTVNFSQVYGQGNEATAEALRISITEAISFKNQYFASIPEVKPFIDTVQAVIRQRGYVTNFYGRRRRLDYNSAYKGPNALIQGWAADYIKNKMVGIYKYIRYNKLKTYLSNIVHDELVENIHKDELEHVPVLRYLLSDFDTYRCKITAGAEYGTPSWGQKETPKEDVGFKEPEDKGYLDYNLFDGHVFDINMEVV